MLPGLKRLPLTDLIKFLIVYVAQLALENMLRHTVAAADYLVFSPSLTFFAGLVVYAFKPGFRWFALLQLLGFALFLMCYIPHNYYFNLFSFYSRYDYLFLNTRAVLGGLLLASLCLGFVLLFAKMQFVVLASLRKRVQVIITFYAILLGGKAVWILVNPIPSVSAASRMLTVADISTFRSIGIDYEKFATGVATRYRCAGLNNFSPSWHYLSDQNGDRDLLILMESWGTLKDPALQRKCINYLRGLFPASRADNGKVTGPLFDEACFHGNTASAEGRELLNVNDEESYQSFLNNPKLAAFNIVKQKKMQQRFTIAGFTASIAYDRNWSNAEGFRKLIGFDSRFYYEDLAKRPAAPLNRESPYKAVDDEVMIDSLFEESQKHAKVFAYGLTINTHSQFTLDHARVDPVEYRRARALMLPCFSGNIHAFDQFFRISRILRHISVRLREQPRLFDRVLIIGDHANPDIRSRELYSQEKVPYIFIGSTVPAGRSEKQQP